jgi:hypothetical protein
VDFRTATDQLKGCITHEELAAELGISPQTVRVARLDPESANARPAPEGWESAIAKLARRRAAELTRLAERFESVL